MWEKFNITYAIFGVVILILIVTVLVALGMSKAWALAIPAGAAAGLPKEALDTDSPWWGASDETEESLAGADGGTDVAVDSDSVDVDLGC